jgi:hypothetical protein
VKTYIYSRHWLRKTTGIALIIFGVAGMILPIVPGAIPLIIGLELVGIRLAFLDRFLPRDTTTPALAPEVAKSVA